MVTTIMEMKRRKMVELLEPHLPDERVVPSTVKGVNLFFCRGDTSDNKFYMLYPQGNSGRRSVKRRQRCDFPEETLCFFHTGRNCINK